MKEKGWEAVEPGVYTRKDSSHINKNPDTSKIIEDLDQHIENNKKTQKSMRDGNWKPTNKVHTAGDDSCDCESCLKKRK